MRYIDWSNVTNRYRDVANAVDAVDGQESYIAGAEAEVDARLAQKYTVPFTNTPTLAPDLIKDLSIDLTYYKIWLGKKPNEDLKEYIDERFKGLLDGTLTLVSSGGVVVDQLSFAWSDRSDYHTSFGVDDPTNFKVSDDWMDDNSDARGDGNGG